MTLEEKRKVIYKVSLITIIINVVLAVIKLVANHFTNSLAMNSDAIHSVLDILSTFIIVISAMLFKKGEDEKTKKRNLITELVFSVIMALLLLATSVDLIIDGVEAIIKNENNIEFSWVLIVVSSVSIVAKIFIFEYTLKTAKKIDYTPLTANAFHQVADAFTSVATILSIISVKLFNSSIVDSIMSLLISCFILHIAYDIGVECLEKLNGKECHHHHKHNCDKCIPDMEINESKLCENCEKKDNCKLKK